MSSEALERAEALLAVEPGGNVKSAAWWFAAARDMAREVAKLEAAFAVAREREQRLREAARALADAVTDFCMNEAPAEWDGGSLGYTVGGLAWLADDARAALVDEPAAAIGRQAVDDYRQDLARLAESQTVASVGQPPAAADEPGETP